MKKVLLMLSIISIVIMDGCGFNTEYIDKVINGLAKDEAMGKFLETVGYKQLEGPAENDIYGDEGDTYYTYEINGTLHEEFDKINTKEQYEFMSSVIKRQINSWDRSSTLKVMFTVEVTILIVILNI